MLQEMQIFYFICTFALVQLTIKDRKKMNQKITQIMLLNNSLQFVELSINFQTNVN